MAQIKATAVVEFPTPISPVSMIPVSSSLSFLTMSIPKEIALNASSSLIAGSFRKFLVPFAILLTNRLPPSISPLMPISIGRILILEFSARRLTRDFPSLIFLAVTPVTYPPTSETPSSKIPLSAHITTSVLFEISGFEVCPIAPILHIISSNLPSPSTGFSSSPSVFLIS